MNRNKFLLLAVIILIGVQNTCAQSTKTIDAKPGILTAYIDRPGDFYIVQKDSLIKKFDIEGKILSEQKLIPPTIFDPWYGINIFIYYRNENKYFLTDRYVKNLKSYPLDSAFVIEPSLVCLAGEKNIWILDKADWSLKRINTIESKVEAEMRIPASHTQNANFTFMREYQNFLFLLNQNKEVLVFNHLGIFIKKISAEGITHFNFLGEEMYYKINDKLIYYDLFDGKTRTKPVPPNVNMVLLTGQKTIFVFSDSIEILDKTL